jgi:type IV secretion system protein VirB9
MGSLTLSGCSHFTSDHNQGMQSKKTSEGFVKAQNAKNVQTRVVKKYVPVPMPGQLKPVPQQQPDLKRMKGSKEPQGRSDQSSKPEFKSKKKAVAHANQMAKRFPQQDDFFNAMMTYDYMPGAVYTIYTSPMKVTDVVLQQGEKLISQAAGDTLRWQIAKTYAGEGDQIQQHLLIKPNKPGLENTLVITTNKRTYHLILKSTDKDSYMVSVKWNYPTNMVSQFSGSLPSGRTPKANTSKTSNSASSRIDTSKPKTGDQCPDLNVKQMKFGYKMKMIQGQKPSWAPQQIFSTQRKTYLKFSQRFMKHNDDLPILKIGGLGKGSKYGTMSNWRFQCGYIIIDQVADKIRLVKGINSADNRVVLQISR